MVDQPPSSSRGNNIAQAAFERVEDAVKRGVRAESPSIGALLEQWLAQKAKFPQLAHPVRRSPAALDQIGEAETRLGRPLPSDLRDLYVASDGLDWVVPEGQQMLPRQGYFPHLSALRLAGDLATPLSKFVAESRRNRRRFSENPTCVEICEPSMWGFLNESAQTIQFDELNSLLSLQSPVDATCLLMVHAPLGGLVPGTVLDFESLRATRYTSLSQWLAVQVELGSLWR